jgi:hypothetical protein
MAAPVLKSPAKRRRHARSPRHHQDGQMGRAYRGYYKQKYGIAVWKAIALGTARGTPKRRERVALNCYLDVGDWPILLRKFVEVVCEA